MGRLFGEFATGQRFETPGRTITEADIVAFAGLTGDYNPVHMDEVFAAETEFGGRIAHGPLGIGLVFGLASRLDLIDGTVVALLGVTWEFKAPVRPGDTVRALIEVMSTRGVKNPDHGLLELGFTLLDQHGTIVQTGSARLLMRRTPHPKAKWGGVEAGADDDKYGRDGPSTIAPQGSHRRSRETGGCRSAAGARRSCGPDPRHRGEAVAAEGIRGHHDPRHRA